MRFLVAVVVLIGALTVLNLFLTMAIIRRIKQTNVAPRREGSEIPELEVGTRIPDFRAESTSGAVVTNADFFGTEAVLAFYDTGCAVCKTTIPKLIDHAQVNGLKADQVIAVVGGRGNSAADYVDGLDGAATVVLEDSLGPVASAFSIPGFPAFVVVDADGRVVRAGTQSTLDARA
ncbi:TlpA family protein disulfide reductase [Streptomyces sp. NPDC054884]|uniref:TlpA family protein disulfide reductase n=1 Tax=Streptomyces sp. ME08-AFT2 TaxID=3028683 RepID=UPI0029B858C5|nr:TlpA disulfide reductase family protein [Streptomyces sp. ME08-AFT2]MDX3312768.1 TlpA disulfide reductase family protein [Streptomyces sp. ME08-AFT2]